MCIERVFPICPIGTGNACVTTLHLLCFVEVGWGGIVDLHSAWSRKSHFASLAVQFLCFISLLALFPVLFLESLWTSSCQCCSRLSSLLEKLITIVLPLIAVPFTTRFTRPESTREHLLSR